MITRIETTVFYSLELSDIQKQARSKRLKAYQRSITVFFFLTSSSVNKTKQKQKNEEWKAWMLMIGKFWMNTEFSSKIIFGLW